MLGEDLAKGSIPLVLREWYAEPECVCNRDETGVEFGAQIHKALNPCSVKGMEREIDMIMVLLCTNEWAQRGRIY